MKNIFWIYLMCLFASCEGVSGKLLIMEGNYHSSGGRYTRAIHSYQKALKYAGSAPYAQTGLGVLYYHLEEISAAQQRFQESGNLLDTLVVTEHRELRYRNSYNSGITRFAQGDFTAAAGFFRDALCIDPGRIDAKRNLELSLLSAAREKSSSSAAALTPEEITSRDVLFDYLGRREQNQWKSREWENDELYEGPDY